MINKPNKVKQPAALLATQAFAEFFKNKARSSRILYVKQSDMPFFSNAADFSNKTLEDLDDLSKEITYDLIIADLPIGLGSVEYVDPDSQRRFFAQRNWVSIFRISKLLSKHGILVAVAEPLAFSSPRGRTFSKQLADYEIFISAIFGTPKGICLPYTSIQPTIVLFSRTYKGSIFIAELESDTQVFSVLKNFFEFKNSDNLEAGVIINRNEFVTISQYKISKQIEVFENQFSNYSTRFLTEIAGEISSTKESGRFEEHENAIYLPKLATSRVVASLQEATMQHKNYYQIDLKPAIASKRYVAIFFSSTLGKTWLQALASGNYIPHINRESLSNIRIPLPKLDEQEFIVETFIKLSRLKMAIVDFEKELATSPSSAHNIQDHLDAMLKSLNMLTDADRVLALIRERENRRVEFKQTLMIDIKINKPAPYIELSALKTIAAFLNSEGGTLLIGVCDDYTIWGVNKEAIILNKSIDKFLLHLKNLIKSRIGEEFYDQIEYRIVAINSDQVLFIECKKSHTPCYLDGRDFYVRVNPATDKLEGPKLVQYIKSHFRE